MQHTRVHALTRILPMCAGEIDSEIPEYLMLFFPKAFENSPNKGKQWETSKHRFWLWLSVAWETLKLTRYQSRKFSYISFILSQNKGKSFVRAQLEREDLRKISLGKIELSLVFDAEKLTFPLAQGIQLDRRALVLIPFLISRHKCENSRNSCHLITWEDNIQARAHFMCGPQDYDLRPRLWLLVTHEYTRVTYGYIQTKNIRQHTGYKRT